MGSRRAHLVGRVICLVAAVITGHVAVGCGGGGGGGSAPAPVPTTPKPKPPAPVPPAPVPITAQLAFLVSPDTVPAGAQFLEPIQVVLQDFGGATITTATTAVSLSIASGPTGGALGGARTVNPVNGVATFTDLTLTPTGTYALRAAASGATTATSVSFEVGALAAADGLGHLDVGVMNFARSRRNDSPYDQCLRRGQGRRRRPVGPSHVGG